MLRSQPFSAFFTLSSVPGFNVTHVPAMVPADLNGAGELSTSSHQFELAPVGCRATISRWFIATLRVKFQVALESCWASSSGPALDHWEFGNSRRLGVQSTGEPYVWALSPYSATVGPVHLDESGSVCPTECCTSLGRSKGKQPGHQHENWKTAVLPGCVK